MGKTTGAKREGHHGSGCNDMNLARSTGKDGSPSDGDSERLKKKGTLAMLAASLCFSTGGVLIKLIPWGPLAINGVRNLIAACVIGIYMAVLRHRIRLAPAVWLGALCMAGVTTAFTMATKLTTAGNAIVLQYTAPVWILLFMAMFYGRKPGRHEIASVAIVLAGIFCFVCDSLSTGRYLGDLLGLLSGLFYAGVFMLNQFEGGDALSSMFLGQLSCGILLSPFAFMETDFSPKVMAAVFILGAVQVGMAYIFFSIGTRHTGPITAAIINAVEPILNPVLVAVFYGEGLGIFSLAGAMIVIGGILFYNLSGRVRSGVSQ